MAGEVVGGAFLSAFLQVLFDRLASPELIRIFSKQKLDDGLRKKMKTTLLALQAVLDDAEDKQITNKSVKAWLDELQHLIHQADDLLDEITTKALRDSLEATHDQSLTQSSTTQVGFNRFLRPIKQSLFCINQSVSTSVYLSEEEIESRMKEIIRELESFVEQKKTLELKDYVGRKSSQRLPTASLVYEDEVCGRKDDKEKIIELLLSANTTGNEIPVIPIVGMAGIGKTTLAQFVYNDARLNDNFSMRSWVCVSDAFDISIITKKILDDLTSSDNDMISSFNQLQTKLKEMVAGKKFLIVLDDVWNDNYIDWDILRRPLKAGALESRIIVTTRNDTVASMMGTIASHFLEQLSFEDCWSLFAKHAFVNRDYMAYPELESIGREIVKKCGGLPLAVKSLGGLLRSKLKIEEWENILKSKIWDLDRNIPPALRLSYHYLPSHLKQCFALCSIFPKDYEFQKKKLVRLWIALDFVQQPKSNNSVEDEGNDCFHELLSRSFFQRLDSYFVMHDLIHDLAQDISGDFCFRLDYDKKLVHISEKVCYFSYVLGEYDGFENFRVLNEVKCLRTFMSYSRDRRLDRCYLGNKVLHDMLPFMRCLRVLSLSKYQISELPPSIENLIHLRYLDLSWTRIKQLPDSVTTLCNLQILNLLRCEYLTELPVDMGKLIYLRHLDIRGTKLTEMPTQMSMLKDLQCLAYFVVGKNRGSRISGLKELCHLGGKLEILGLENVVSGQDALEALMKDKKHLKQLELKWGGDANDSTKERDVLDKLQPHIGLKSLGIFNYGGTKFPNWLDGAHSLRNIVSLQLTRCTNCYFLPSIGQLPSLKYLKIDGMKQITKVGREFYEDASSSSSIKPFQSLELLSFKQMEEWEEWHALGAGEFSCLLRLYLVDCPKLTGELCTRFPCLRKLEISKCQRLVSHQVGLLLQGLPSLQDLKMSDMKNLTELPQQLQNLSTLQKLEISRMQNLKEFPPELCGLIKLERLKIAICPSLVSILDTGLPPMLKTLEIKECEALQTTTVAAAVGLPHPTLKELVIDECRSLEFPLPEETELNFNKSIEVLGITGRCHLLKSLPLGFFPNLRSLNIRGGKNFETLSISDCEFQNLMEFRIGDYPRMVSFSQGGLAAPNLTYFSVSHCKNLKSLPQRMPTLLPSLEVLLINNCPEIESFPDGGLPSNLRELVIQHNCEKLVKGRMGWGLQTLQSLEKFTITGEYKEVLESFPEEWLLPTTLTNLCLWWLSNLNSLNHKGLQHLTSLTHLRMHKCGKFQSLPEEGLPNSLSHLYISKCPLLKPRCQSVKGEDWPIISRIRHIRMDDEDIVNLE